MVVFCRLSDMRSLLRLGVHVSLFLWDKLVCSSVPSFCFSYIPCSLILSLFPSKFGLSSSVPLKLKAIFPCSPKPPRMPHMHLTDRPGQWAQQLIIHIVWLQNNQIGQNWIYRVRVKLNKIGTPKWLGPVAQSIVSSGPNTFVEVDHEIFSIVILLLPVIQEGILSVTSDSVCTKYCLV